MLFWQRLAQMQHISGLQGASGMAAKLPQGKGALAAQILRRGKAAFDQQIAAGAAVGDLAQLLLAEIAGKTCGVTRPPKPGLALRRM